MTPYRSTSLKLVEAACPRALDFSEASVPYDRDVFQVGIVAHAVLEGLQRASMRKGYALHPEEQELVKAALAAPPAA